MASSQWLLVAATLAVLFIGSADAWNQWNNKCNPGWAICNLRVRWPKCDTCIFKDPLNCGKCGNCCKQVPNAVTNCEYGKCCPPVCNPGYGNCDKNIWNGCETSLSSDPLNCGSCGNCCKQVTNAVTSCKYGKCCPPVCNPGWGNCDNDIWNGCEKNLNNDILNCGSCGYCCPVTWKGGEATCSNGKCGQQCKTGTQWDNASKCCIPIRHY